jgi:hypothetical protein
MSNEENEETVLTDHFIQDDGLSEETINDEAVLTDHFIQYDGLSEETILAMDNVHDNPSFQSNTLASLPEHFIDTIVSCELSDKDNPVYEGTTKKANKPFKAVFYVVTFEGGKKASMFSSVFPFNPRLQSPIGMLGEKTSDFTMNFTAK